MNIEKKYFLSFIVFITFGLHAEDFDGSVPLLCATTELFECTLTEGCVEVQPDEINAPKFLQIDYTKKIIEPIPKRDPDKNSKIEHSKDMEGKLILQGIEESIEGVRAGLGWTVTIMEDTGNFTLTASGDDVGFVLLGACTEL